MVVFAFGFFGYRQSRRRAERVDAMVNKEESSYSLSQLLSRTENTSGGTAQKVGKPVTGFVPATLCMRLAENMESLV